MRNIDKKLSDTIESVFETDGFYKKINALSEDKFGVYVPSTIRDKKISANNHNAIVNIVAKSLAEIGGGATIETKNGAYVAENGDYITENVTFVWTYAPMPLDSDSKKTRHELAMIVDLYGNAIGKLLSQDSMLIVVENIPMLLNNWD